VTDQEDALATIVNLLSGSWVSTNTDSITPSVDLVINFPNTVDIQGKTEIKVYSAGNVSKPASLSPTEEATVDRVSIDIRTMLSYPHLRRCYNEIRRIFSTKISLPDSYFDLLQPSGFQDFSDKRKGLYRYVYDVSLEKWGQRWKT